MQDILCGTVWATVADDFVIAAKDVLLLATFITCDIIKPKPRRFRGITVFIGVYVQCMQ